MEQSGSDGNGASPDGLVSDRLNVYEQARELLSSAEWERFTRGMQLTVDGFAERPELVLLMLHGLAHTSAMSGDRNVAETFKAMAHATAIDLTTELEVAALRADLDSGMPQEGA